MGKCMGKGKVWGEMRGKKRVEGFMGGMVRGVVV
ncbi:hypothetical protein [Bacillus altitudinis]|nr:hypothetical protein [Bacillus altitudinis]